MFYLFLLYFPFTYSSVSQVCHRPYTLTWIPFPQLLSDLCADDYVTGVNTNRSIPTHPTFTDFWLSLPTFSLFLDPRQHKPHKTPSFPPCFVLNFMMPVKSIKPQILQSDFYIFFTVWGVCIFTQLVQMYAVYSHFSALNDFHRSFLVLPLLFSTVSMWITSVEKTINSFNIVQWL